MLHLIRHASAGHRSGAADDAERPLDDRGRAQAQRIADHLGKDPLTRVLSSPAVRCRQSIAPLAQRLSVDVEPTMALYEGAGGARALELVQELASQGVDAALCSHGDVIPHLLDLLSLDTVATFTTRCSKGSIWTLTVHDGQVSEAHYTDMA